ncbi:hypothetical protein QA641_44040 [Bradyrhizobium sp. CB1650]|uniref:hypothetical protein n=1 Tax=Bradyrhizobium sp. CB1650 TaxID=3039153 RepID=UPI002435F12F|nr:hypothetical protein [Bradyrhizobium sp. CB1650]WGD52291.1 hypothetical protein QA641_44040 [Bradyrhizobium sp. CB1650]
METLARELAAARRDLESLQNLLNKEREESGRVESALQSEATELRKSLKEMSQGGAPDPQKSLREERGRAARLEQDLAAARRDVETLTALAVKASDEAARLRQAPQNGGGDLQKSLEQEHARTARLERDLAAARRDVETLAALAVKASSEAARLKQAPQSGGADLQKALEQEVARSARLERDLAAARRDAERQAAPAAKAGDEAAEPKQASQSGAADLRKSLEQEHARSARLEQDLVAARRDVEKQAALAAKASGEAAELKKASQSSADLRKSLEQEHARSARLEQDLAASRRDVEMQAALATKASDEAAKLKQASQSGAADSQKALEQEHARAARLEQDLAAARRDVETQAALATKASDEAAKLKQASQSGAADLQKSLEQERARTTQLEQDLAASRRDAETQAASAAKTGDELAKLKLATEAGAAELRRLMQKERERADALAQDLSMARTKIYAYEAQAAKANDEAAQRKQAEAGDTAELRQSLQRERQRAEQLARDLALKGRDRDAQAERAAEANAQVAGMKRAAEQAVAEQRNLLQRERGRAEQLEKDLASARRDIAASAAKVPPAASQAVAAGTTGRTVQEKPVGAPGPTEEQATMARIPGKAEPHPDDGMQEARLMARARLLLERGDVGGARIVLERVAETGSAQASFALAETYDPLILSSWGTYGTRGDATKARDLYAKAEAGGIKEAKVRFEALRR